MRRFARYALNALAALSLPLCVATVLLWVRSYWWNDYALLPTRGGKVPYTLQSVAGRLQFSRLELVELRGSWSLQAFIESEPMSTSRGAVPSTMRDPNTGGLRWWVAERDPDDGHGDDLSFVVLPHVVLVVAFGICPAIVAGRRLSRRRLRVGLCPRCRYDLTGNVSGVCPECGTKVG